MRSMLLAESHMAWLPLRGYHCLRLLMVLQGAVSGHLDATG